MSTTCEANCTPVRLMCSRRAQHTYEVTFSREPEVKNLNYSSGVTNALRRIEQRKLRRENDMFLQQEALNKTLPSATGDGAFPEVPRKMLCGEFGDHKGDGRAFRSEGGHDSLPRSESMRSVYYDTCKRRYRSAESSDPSPHTSTLKSARGKLIEFLQTEEFFDEYSFFALMTLMLAHMYRLSHAIFEMSCTAQSILGVLMYVWRFMQARVADILTTCGGPQAAYKCAIFCIELIVVFASIFLFLWAVFIPVCGLIAVIASKILSLFM